MSSANVKQQAHKLVDQLSDDATWDDVVYEMVARREIEKGLADSDAGRTMSAEDVEKEFGIAE
jgi:predicted transcriptional regulator